VVERVYDDDEDDDEGDSRSQDVLHSFLSSYVAKSSEKVSLLSSSLNSSSVLGFNSRCGCGCDGSVPGIREYVKWSADIIGSFQSSSRLGSFI
jgi:hypothetical protein